MKFLRCFRGELNKKQMESRSTTFHGIDNCQNAASRKFITTDFFTASMAMQYLTFLISDVLQHQNFLAW